MFAKYYPQKIHFERGILSVLQYKSLILVLRTLIYSPPL